MTSTVVTSALSVGRRHLVPMIASATTQQCHSAGIKKPVEQQVKLEFLLVGFVNSIHDEPLERRTNSQSRSTGRAETQWWTFSAALRLPQTRHLFIFNFQLGLLAR